MTTRRHQYEPNGDERSGAAAGDPAGGDPWDAIGHPDHDDFWADVPDWSPTASTSRRSGLGRIGVGDVEDVDPTPIGHQRPPTERTGVVGALKGVWNGLVGDAPDVTREHGRIVVDDTTILPDEPVSGTPVGERASIDAHLFDDLDEGWDAVGEPAPARGAGHVDEFHSVGDDHIERHEGGFAGVDDFHPVERRPIDPLLMRMGAVVIVACLLVPMFIAVLRTDGTVDDAANSIASVTDVVDGSDATGDVPTASTPDAAPTVTEPLDPASLPRAIPVNPDPSTDDDDSSGSSETAVVDDAADEASTTSTASEDSSSESAVAASTQATDGVEQVAAPAAADSPAARVDPPVCPVAYTVVEGDFWLRLVDAADVELSDLLEVNSATVDTPLFPGSEICLPEGANAPAPPTTAAPTTAAPTTAAPTTAAPTTAAPTTAAPTTTPATTPPTTAGSTSTPSSTESTPEQVQQIIRDIWPDDLEDRAIEIAFRESRFVPTAKNFCCYGIFQMYWEVHDVWLVDLGITSASQLYDPATNARAALALYERAGGWGPWGF